MTDKELRRLKRVDLLELLIAQSRENEELRAELAELREQLENRDIALKNAGSIADAALQINGVFQAAQDAADQYLESIRNMEQATKQKCRQLLEAAQQTAGTPQETQRP